MKRLLRVLQVIAGALLLGYLLVCALLFGLQRQLTFPAPRELFSVDDGNETVRVPGGTFFLWKTVPGTGPVVVHFHGNGEQVSYLSWLGEAWQRNGVSFVAVEYPGYPGAGGAASEESIVAAGEAALQYLTVTLKIDRSRLVLEGQSIGTGVAVTLSTRGWGVRLVLLSPYTSLPAVAQRAFPWLPTGLLLLDRFDSESRGPDVKVPTLIVHGTNDPLIPIDLGRALALTIPGSKFLAIEGAEHNDLLERETTQNAIFAFVTAK